jgi:DNA-binding winged helix-turn-helix (wHTH) protein/tetratricopeptide (TPR) repeat protein
MKETLPDRVRLGSLVVDLRAGELRQGEGAVLVLPDQPLQILRMLVEANGEIVTREEIRERLWPDDTVVEFDHSINTAIKKLRRALVDSGDEPHYIGTIAKRGYRLLVPVERVEAAYSLDELPRPSPEDGLERGTQVFADARGRDDKREKLLAASTPAGVIAQAAAAVGVDEPSVQASTVGQRWHRRGTRVVAAVVVFAAAIAGTVYWRTRRAPKLTERDTIVLADFDNQTGDAVFDDTLKQALSAQLSQSPFVNVLPNRQVRSALNEINRSTNELLTADLARQVCQHAGSKAVLAGSIGSFGKEYILELKAADCSSRQILGEAQERAPGKGEVLKALDEAAISVRKQMGEPLISVQKFAMPSAQATEPSLEAWKAYTTGTKIYSEQGIAAGLPFYKRAVEIDPNFARAYNALSIAYEDMHETKLSDEYGRRAYELRNTVTERERFTIESHYYENTTGELDKAAHTYKLWQQSYPKDVSAYLDFGFLSTKLGNLEDALEAMREAMRLRPDSWIAYIDLASAYVNLNRLEEAEEVYKAADEHNIANDSFRSMRFFLGFLRGDKTQMKRWSQDEAGRPSTDEGVLSEEVDIAAWYGRFRDARKLTEQAMNAAERNGSQESAAVYRIQAALREAAGGNLSQARSDVGAARALGRSADINAMAAIALAMAGEAETAETLADELDKEHPLNTLVQRYWLPTVRASIALHRKQPDRAIELLKGMGSLELGMVCNLAPAYVRGEAYLMLQDGPAAAAEFQKFIDHYGVAAAFPWGALARLGLARAYALEAERDPAAREKARVAYQNFLTLWKDADPDIPIYKQAKAEYARLQ